jgi:hypothetical protein
METELQESRKHTPRVAYNPRYLFMLYSFTKGIRVNREFVLRVVLIISGACGLTEDVFPRVLC